MAGRAKEEYQYEKQAKRVVFHAEHFSDAHGALLLTGRLLGFLPEQT
jgi:hypothetical protein